MEKKGGGTRAYNQGENAPELSVGVGVHLTGMCKTKTIQHQCVFRDELLLKIFSQPRTSLMVWPEPFPPTVSRI